MKRLPDGWHHLHHSSCKCFESFAELYDYYKNGIIRGKVQVRNKDGDEWDIFWADALGVQQGCGIFGGNAEEAKARVLQEISEKPSFLM